MQRFILFFITDMYIVLTYYTVPYIHCTLTPVPALKELTANLDSQQAYQHVFAV